MTQAHEHKLMKTKARILATTENYDELLEIAKSKAPDPAVFDEFSPAFWSATVSSNRIDYYKTAMSRQTLENFARGLNDGVSFQGSHEYRKLGFGQSIHGELMESEEDVEHVGGNLLETHGTFMTLSGVQTQEGSTNDFLAMIRSGGWKDVSVGFYASNYACSICGLDPWDWWSDDYCEHIPGMLYDVEGEQKLAFVWINDGELLEVSQVYDGASPGAEVNNVVTKTQALATERIIGEREIVAVENMFQARINRPGIIVPADMKAKSLSKGSTDMKREKAKPEEMRETEEPTTANDDKLEELDETELEETEVEEPVADPETETDDETEGETEDDDETTFAFDDDDEEDAEEEAEEERAAVDVTIQDLLTETEIGELSERGIRLGKNVPKAIRALADALIEERKRSRENAAMAEVGRKQRDVAIEEALRSGTRAFGQGFDEERQRRILSGMTYDDIRHMQNTYEQQVEDKFKRTPPIAMTAASGENEDDGETPKTGVRSRKRFRA